MFIKLIEFYYKQIIVYTKRIIEKVFYLRMKQKAYDFNIITP